MWEAREGWERSVVGAQADVGAGREVSRRYARNALHRRVQRLTPSYRSAYVLAISENSSPSPACNPSVARSAIIASIHNADLAPVLAPAAIADIFAPVPAPGYYAVSGSRTLPHPSYARMERVGRRLAFPS